MEPRRGMTLLEVVVCLGIVAVLLALILCAIQTVREKAMRLQSMSQLSQVNLATHSYASAYGGRLPTVDARRNGQVGGPVLFDSLLPYLDAQAYAYILEKKGFPRVRVLLSPADPTVHSNDFPVTSYAANAQVFINDPSMLRTFQDGSANTITFAEHYAGNCGGTSFWYMLQLPVPYSSIRRPTFADGGPRLVDPHGDDYPVTTGTPPSSVGYFQNPSFTFQAAPRPEEASAFLAQTPHPSGMLAAMGDGSVRILRRSIDPTIYWGAVTPAGGEQSSGDW